MHWSQNSSLRALGCASLVLGGIAYVRALSAIAQFRIEPAAADDWVDYSQGMLVVGSFHMVSGWAVLRRNHFVRPLLTISSFVLLIFYAGSVVTPPQYAGAGRIGLVGGVLHLLALVPIFWLTFLGTGKETLKSHVVRDNGLRGSLS